MAVGLLGMVFGLAFGITGTSLYYSGKLIAANRRINQLEKQTARATAEPRF